MTRYAGRARSISARLTPATSDEMEDNATEFNVGLISECGRLSLIRVVLNTSATSAGSLCMSYLI